MAIFFFLNENFVNLKKKIKFLAIFWHSNGNFPEGHVWGYIRLAPDWIRLAPKETNLGLFKISFQYSYSSTRRTKMYWKLNLISPRYVPFRAYLIKFGINLTPLTYNFCYYWCSIKIIMYFNGIMNVRIIANVE